MALDKFDLFVLMVVSVLYLSVVDGGKSVVNSNFDKYSVYSN